MQSSFDNLVIYHIFIDRFAGYTQPLKWDDPVFIGGTLKGIIDKLAYIKSLGVNAIWLSPHCATNAYHGYHVTDYYSVDPHFGTENDLKELIDKAHNLGIKMIMDFVPNHCSYEHPYFIDAITNPKSQYRDWFTFKKWPSDYLCFLSYEEIPKLNLDNSKVMDHLLDSARRWLSLGFDGIRIDHIVGLSNKNVKKLFSPLKQEYPESFYLAEAWFHGIKWGHLKTLKIPKKHLIWILDKIGLDINNLVFKNYVGLIDGLLDFEMAKLFEEYASAQLEQSAKVKNKVIQQSNRFKIRMIQYAFLDNHDRERFMFKCGNDKDKLMAAAELQFSLKQPAIIYYGTEVGMTHDKPFGYRKHHSDLLVRQPMIWDESKQNKELLDFYKQLIRQKTSDNL
jgi:glycosidase